MLKWTDLLGQDLVATDKIKAAKNNEELRDILYEHEQFLEAQLSDSLSSVESLKRELKLYEA